MRKKVRDVEWDQVKYQLEQISNTNILTDGFVCYISSMGGLSKNDFELLVKRNDLVFCRIDQLRPRSFFHKVLSLILPSYWGIAEVKNLSKIDEILDLFTEQAMAEIYLFNKMYKDDFIKKIHTSANPINISDYVKEYSDFFMYQLDTDNEESESGMVEIVSYGRKCPDTLKAILDLTYFK